MDLSCVFLFSFFLNIMFVYFLVLYLLYNTVIKQFTVLLMRHIGLAKVFECIHAFRV